MRAEEIEALKKEYANLKIKLRNTKSLSKSLTIERRMIEINKILTKELKTCMW